MFSALNENGRAAIISGQGTLFRGSKEEEIRKRMILGDDDKNLQGDIIEGIIALPNTLFYVILYLLMISTNTVLTMGRP